MTLYRKHRPKRFEHMLGNEEVISSLSALIKRDQEDIPQAVLFEGPYGCGKTTLARIFSEMLGCKGTDLQEVDVADFRGIDTSRDIRRRMHLMPQEEGSQARVWILDEVHEMTKQAQDALLKALEDTPTRVFFILATTNPEKLNKGIRSRCARFALEPLTNREMIKLLTRISRREKKKIPEEVLKQIAKESRGAPRDALMILEQVMDLPEKEMAKGVASALRRETEIIALCRSLMSKQKWNTVKGILCGLPEGTNPEGVRLAVRTYCSKVLLGKESPQAYVVMNAFDSSVPYSSMADVIQACFEGTVEMKGEDPDEDVPF